ncbi:MAG: GH3 auxin-responsive promoter family protein [Flavobacteriia bacterium]
MPFNSIFAWMMKKRIHQIELFRKYPLEVQSEILLELVSTAENTEFGKKHGFSSIKIYQDFKNQVPLNTYESLKPLIDRVISGDNQVLWPTETKWFAKSSGTTSDRSKFIPVSKESLFECHYKGGKDLLALYYENFPNRKLYNGKHLIVGGSAQINPIDIDSYFGDLSAIIVKNLPWWAEIRRTPSRETALMSEWEAKIDKMARETIEEDVYILAGVPSWTYILLQKVLEISGKEHIKEVWPNLELFLHGGVNFEPYRASFEKLIPSPEMNYVETYNASEGFFGIQDKANSNELLLMLDYGIFYEFIPMSAFNGLDSKEVVDLSEVKLNENYDIVISTNGGLWRYILGDTIQFTSLLPFRFRITGRTKSFINVFGEEVIVENAEKALANACIQTNSAIQEFTAGPVYLEEGKKGKHEWLIEFSTLPQDLNLFAEILDAELRKLNSDYDAKRYKSLLLENLSVKSIELGTFDAWLKSKGKLGGQHKIPRLSNDRKILEEIYRFC